MIAELEKFNNIRHMYLLNYRDIFQHWNHNDSALYTIVVSDHQKNGSLNDSGFVLNEERLRVILAQVTDALLTVHRSQLSHNNVKITNIYLDQQGYALLGDFLPMSALLYRKDRRLNAQNTTPLGGEQNDIHSLGYILKQLIANGKFSNELSDAAEKLTTASESLQSLVDSTPYLTSALQNINSRYVVPNPLQHSSTVARVPSQLGVPGILSYMKSKRYV